MLLVVFSWYIGFWALVYKMNFTEKMAHGTLISTSRINKGYWYLIYQLVCVLLRHNYIANLIIYRKWLYVSPIVIYYRQKKWHIGYKQKLFLKRNKSSSREINGWTQMINQLVNLNFANRKNEHVPLRNTSANSLYPTAR